MSTRTLKVVITGLAKGGQQALRDVQADAKDTRTSFEKLSTKMAGVGSTMTTRVTLPIIAGFGLITKAAGEEQQQMQTLAEVIRRQMPNATQKMIDANEKWITKFQNSTAIADSELRAVQQKFIAAGASIEEAQRMTASAFDTAAATGKEYNSIADAMVKGMNGQTAGFSRLGIETENVDGSMKSLDQILQDLAVHQGIAADKADNAAGRSQVFGLKMADLGEKLGMVLIPVLDKAVSWFSKIADWFNNLPEGADKVVIAILALAAAIGPLLIVGAKLVTSFGIIKDAFKALNLAFMTNPWTLLIAATVALVALIIANWDKIKAAALAAKDWIIDKWNAVVTFFRELPSKIGNVVRGLTDLITAPFKAAFNAVARFWNNTVGKLSFKIPGWVPGIGGMGFDVPDIPTFHLGGVYRAPRPGGVGLALLRDEEEILTPEQRGRRGGNTSVVVYAMYDIPGLSAAIDDGIGWSYKTAGVG